MAFNTKNNRLNAVNTKPYWWLYLIAIVIASASCSTTGNLPVGTTPEVQPTVKLNSKDRVRLLRKARDWGVPQPDAGAGLVKVWVFRRGSDANAEDFYALGFTHPDDPQHALVGFARWDLAQHGETLDVPDATGLSLDDISPNSPFGGVHAVNFGLITGIQLLRRGDERLGLALIGKSLGEESGHHRSAFKSPAGEAPVAMLARSCLAARLNEITSPEPDFMVIRQRVNQLLADQPELKSEATDWAVGALAASVAHRPSPVGSVGRVVDDFLMSGGTEGGLLGRTGSFAPAERALILKGFEAIPALLEQRHSKRFTNHLMLGFNNFTSYPMSAGQVVDAYLQRFSNGDFRSNWLMDQQGYELDDDAVAKWWEEASAMGEEEYVKRYALAKNSRGRWQLSNELLLLAEQRYPELVPGIRRSVRIRRLLGDRGLPKL